MILDLKEAKNVEFVGNKARGLYELIKLGLNVPKGFVISYNSSIDEISDFIGKYCSNKNVYVVRSSSNSEDSQKHSFAGLFDTIIGVKKKDLLEKIMKVRNIEENQKIINFCKKINKNISDIKVSVIVQEIINSDISGICFTKNPVNNSKNETYIEAILGLGEYVVSGEVNPDVYIYNKKSKKIKIKASTQHKLLKYKDGKTKCEAVFSYTQKLDDSLIRELCSKSILIEKYFKKGMDIEFAFKDNNLYFLQARPITT